MEDKMAYLVVTLDGVDQVCEDAEDAAREAQELDGYIHVCPWEHQDAVVETLNRELVG